MKINLPAAPTGQKIQTFLLLFLTNLSKLQAGPQYEACVGSGNYTGISNYINGNGYTGTYFCCYLNNSSCYVSWNSTAPCFYNGQYNAKDYLSVQCFKVGNSTSTFFCTSSLYEGVIPGHRKWMRRFYW